MSWNQMNDQMKNERIYWVELIITPLHPGHFIRHAYHIHLPVGVQLKSKAYNHAC